MSVWTLQLCATPLRPYNLGLAASALELGGNGAAESESLLENAMLGLDGVPFYGMSLEMKSHATTMSAVLNFLPNAMYQRFESMSRGAGKSRFAPCLPRP